jgi:hypothetical protein
MAIPRGFSGGAGAKFAVRVRGAEKVKRAFDNVFRASQNNLFDAMNKSVLSVEAESKRLVTSGYYQPAIDTNRMRGSITGVVERLDRDKTGGRVGTNVYYSVYVHEGLGQHKEPRPFLVDALKKQKDKITEWITDAIRNAKKRNR